MALLECERVSECGHWKPTIPAHFGSPRPRPARATIALRFWNDRSLLTDTAAEQSRTTHAAEEAVDACRAFAELLADAIAGTPRSLHLLS